MLERLIVLGIYSVCTLFILAILFNILAFGMKIFYNFRKKIEEKKYKSYFLDISERMNLFSFLLSRVRYEPWIFREYYKVYKTDAIKILNKTAQISPDSEKSIAKSLIHDLSGASADTCRIEINQSFYKEINKFKEFYENHKIIVRRELQREVDPRVFNFIKISSIPYLSTLVSLEQNYSVLWFLSMALKDKEYVGLVRNMKVKNESFFLETERMSIKNIDNYLQAIFLNINKENEYKVKTTSKINKFVHPVKRFKTSQKAKKKPLKKNNTKHFKEPQNKSL